MRSIKVLAVIATVLAAPLAACGGDPELEVLRAPKVPLVERVTATHPVSFEPASADLSGAERQRLAAFAEDLRRDRTTVMLLTAPDTPALQALRAESVQNQLQALGVSTASVSTARGYVVGSNTVVVSAESYSARSRTNCPDWSKIGGVYDPLNGVHSNLGCATANNLADMVANPRDLAVGRSPVGPASGHLGAAAVDRLYNDKVKAPASQTTSTAQPAGGGGGGGGGGGSN
ncbi:MAG TPA: CpaD family pilus assembly lipoprotein [Vineibacter sp.]|nr:CpaD family pilus assembly lipoprotein [Vineibacter sp.]